MRDSRSAARRFLEVELPVLAILTFALAPYAWMVLTSVKPQAELSLWPVRYLPENATLEHYRELISFMQVDLATLAATAAVSQESHDPAQQRLA